MDAHKNLAYTTVATAPSPALSGTSLVVAAGTGTLFPAVPFNCVVWPAGVNPLTTNAEIIRVTTVSTDTFTIVRTQEGTSARAIGVGDQIANAITAKTLTDVEAMVSGTTNTIAKFTSSTAVGNSLITDSGSLVTAAGPLLVNSSSATALNVGPNGATNPTLTVVTDTASGATGLSVTNAASGSGVTLTALGGTNENILLRPKGTGKVSIEFATGSNQVYFQVKDTTTGHGIQLTPNLNAGGPEIKGLSGGNLSISDAGGSSIVFNNTAGMLFKGNNGSTQAVMKTGKFSVGVGASQSPTYVLEIGPTSSATAGLTVFVQDATASTGSTGVIFKGGAGQSTNNIFQIQDSSANVVFKADATDAYVTNRMMIGAGTIQTGVALTLSKGAGIGTLLRLMNTGSDVGDDVRIGFTPASLTSANIRAAAPGGGLAEFGFETVSGGSAVERFRIYGSTTGVGMGSSSMYSWTSSADPAGTRDTGLGRNAAGVIEINSGTLGTYRDLVARNVLIGQGITVDTTYAFRIGPTSGVTAGQTVFIQDATATTGKTQVTIKAGAVANGTALLIQNSSGVAKVSLGDDGAATFVGDVAVSGILTNSGTDAFGSSGAINGLGLGSARRIIWSSTTGYNGTPDAGFSRDSAGVVQVNNGTAGTLRDIKARQLFAAGDNAGVASTVSLTTTSDLTTTNAYAVKGGQAASTANTGWIKIYVGTTAAWLPYWANATP